MRSIICFEIIKTVFNENLFPQDWNNSSKLLPNSSITITLYSPEIPAQKTLGIPIPLNDWSNFDSNNNWGYLMELCSNFMANFELSKMSMPSYISVKAPSPIFFIKRYFPPTIISTFRFKKKIVVHFYFLIHD